MPLFISASEDRPVESAPRPPIYDRVREVPRVVRDPKVVAREKVMEMEAFRMFSDLQGSMFPCTDIFCILLEILILTFLIIII